MQESGCQGDFLLDCKLQLPYQRDRHHEHDETIHDVWDCHEACKREFVEAFAAFDRLVPYVRHRRALKDGDEGVRDAGTDHDDADYGKHERESTHLAREDAEIQKQDGELGQSD